MTVALGGTVAARPIGFMIFELKDAIVILVAKQAAILANPFHVALLAIVKICHFVLLPTVSETVSVYFNWNSLYFDFLSAQNA